MTRKRHDGCKDEKPMAQQVMPVLQVAHVVPVALDIMDVVDKGPEVLPHVLLQCLKAPIPT